MLLEVTCKCGKTYPVSDRHTGKIARCALCGAELRIPRLGDPGVIARQVHDEPITWEPRPLPEGAADHRPTPEALPLGLEEIPPSAEAAPAAPPSVRHAPASSPTTATPAPTAPPAPPAPTPSLPRTPPSPHVVTPRARRRLSPVTLGLGALAVLLLFAVMGTAYVVYLTYSDMPPDPNASPAPMVAAPAPPTATPASPSPAETPPAPAAVAAPAVAPVPAEPVPASTPPSETPSAVAATPAAVPPQPAPPSPEPVAKPAPVDSIPVVPVTLEGKLTGTWRNIAGQDLELELRRDGTFVIRRPEQLPRSGFPWTVEPDDKPGFVRLNVGGDAAVVRLADDANTLSALRDGQEIPVFQRKSEP